MFLDSRIEVFWILGRVLDFGKCFWLLGRVLDCGKCFFDSGTCFVPTSHRIFVIG